MADCPLTVEGVCAILEACRKSGVSSLTYCGLHVEFKQASSGGETPLELFVSQPEGGETPLSASQGKSGQTARVELTPEEKQVLEDARLSQLMTDDPLAYEQELIDAKLGDDNGEAEDTR